MNTITQEDHNAIRAAAYNKRRYTTDVQVQLGELLTAATQGNEDAYLSELATGTAEMTDITCRVVDWKDDEASTLVISVSGDVAGVPDAVAALRVVEG